MLLRVQPDAAGVENLGQGGAEIRTGDGHGLGLGRVEVDLDLGANSVGAEARLQHERGLVGGGGALEGQVGDDDGDGASVEPAPGVA